ncbi:hypothetical protein [Streptomyces sp. NPDC059828]|uniref:hypothetical protein n=1 Tax=Streptomyces sp. NPDC059828 TaxID=3346965 RepID=UPI0036470FB7
MTTDQALRDAKTRWMRRRRRLISYGQWQPFVQAHPVREHVLAIRTTGMSLPNLATAAGVPLGTLDYLIYGDTNFPPAEKIRPETAETLLGYWPTLDDYVDRAVIDATGTRRRLRALAAIGWPVKAIHKHIDIVTVSTLERARYSQQVTARLARAVRDFYAWASAGTAERYGVTGWVAARCRNAAVADNWEGPPVWDDDTIDDPNAHPEWTGYCGTDRGYWVHRNQQLPMCGRCQQAHDDWLADHAHLPGRDRSKALFAARATASAREADLATDARELMRLGADYEQTAERLRVTRQHLQQALIRHPEQLDTAA